MRSKQVSVVREIRMLRSTWRGLETWHGRDAVTPRNRKGEATGNTNFDLNRRASPRPYLGAPGGEIPPGDSTVASRSNPVTEDVIENRSRVQCESHAGAARIEFYR